jgi:hypothetical protein
MTDRAVANIIKDRVKAAGLDRWWVVQGLNL